MYIDITEFFRLSEPYEFSASKAERGENAGPETWRNAMNEAKRTPLLTSPAEIEALRDYMEGFGAWSREEIAAWTPEKCNALFIQLVSGDIREADIDQLEPDWADYEARAEAGEIRGNIVRGDDGKVYYSLCD